MLSQLINTPCTIVRRTQSADIDDYGNLLPGEETTDTVCDLQQRALQSGREFPDAEISDTTWLLLLLPGTEIDTGDMVVVDGRDYEMVGDPWHVRNPRTQTESHVEAIVRRVAGDLDGDGS